MTDAAAAESGVDALSFVEATSIYVRDRQRSRMDPTKLKELRWSIDSIGILQPPGVWRDELGILHLVWGERRFRAMESLIADGKRIKFQGMELASGCIPVLDFQAERLSERKSAEFAENVEREDLSWQDRTKAYAEIHELKKSENPDQTVKKTAQELIKQGGNVGYSGNTINADQLRQNITMATALTPHLNDPEISKARTVSDAYQILTRRMESQALAALGRATLAERVGPAVTILCADCIPWLKESPAGTFDLILTDPPFGNDADDPNFSKRQSTPHIYQDDAVSVGDKLQTLLIEGFRVCKKGANIFIFCDIDLFTWLRGAASRAGWTPFRTPIIWDKETPGIGPWHNEGFQRSYEFIFFATKGQRGLLRPVRDVREYRRVPTSERVHPAQKPLSLLTELITLATMPGDSVLDPFAGSGSTLVAAKKLHRAATGIEIERGYIDNIEAELAKLDMENQDA